MEFNKQYLNEMEDTEKGGMYLFKKFFPKKMIEKKTEQHARLFQLKRWFYLKKCKRILDIGCGKGNFIKKDPFNSEIYGMDIIKKAVEDLKKEGIPAKQGDLNKKIPFKDNYFDGLSCFHVFEHIPDPTRAVSEIKRVLKDDGKLVIAVPNLSFKKFYEDYTHVKPYTKRSLYKLLKNNNFENINIKNGPCMNQLISATFFLFPRIRFSIEKLIGKISPFEIIAIAKNSKSKNA